MQPSHARGWDLIDRLLALRLQRTDQSGAGLCQNHRATVPVLVGRQSSRSPEVRCRLIQSDCTGISSYWEHNGCSCHSIPDWDHVGKTLPGRSPHIAAAVEPIARTPRLKILLPPSTIPNTPASEC